jgi:alanine racemase
MRAVTYIELDKNALLQNIQYLKKRIGRAKFVSVIKGNAYGHGIEDYLPLAEECGVDTFAVSDTSEADRAYHVKNAATHLIIMNMIDNADLKEIIEYEISFFIYNFHRLEKTIEVAKKINKKAKIHIELETGLNRTGFQESEIDKVVEIISKSREHLDIIGVCTHFAGADSIANYYRIKKQKEVFHKLATKLNKRGITPKYYHSACSAAALTYSDTLMDMVRFGIAQYGFWPSVETRMHNMLSDDKHFTTDPLKRILSWKSSVSSIKSVKAGEFIGYGNNFLSTTDLKVAVIPVGYYHGYSRNLSNLGHVLIRGQKAPVLGLVNMNAIMTDVTLIPGVSIEDEVVIIGTQKDRTISVSSFSDFASYVNYEMLVRLPYEIPRYIVG